MKETDEATLYRGVLFGSTKLLVCRPEDAKEPPQLIARGVEQRYPLAEPALLLERDFLIDLFGMGRKQDGLAMALEQQFAQKFLALQLDLDRTRVVGLGVQALLSQPPETAEVLRISRGDIGAQLMGIDEVEQFSLRWGSKE
jgi:hypothetical protein